MIAGVSRWSRAGAVPALVAAAVALAVPRGLSEPASAAGGDARIPQERACGMAVSCAAPGADGWSALLQAQLATRVPGLPGRERLRLAAAIAEESARAGLDPLFVLALIEVESGWDTGALSRRGAQGLMQLRPAALRGEVGRSGALGDDLLDPVVNVRAGIRYLASLEARFQSRDLALMAYNAGPTRVRALLRAGGVPERLRAYPRRVHAELRRLRRALAMEGRTAVAARMR